MDWRDKLNSRNAYLQNLRNSLSGCIGCGRLSMKNCQTYNQADKLAAEGSGPVILDRGVTS